MKTTRFLFAWLFMLVAIPAFVACGDDDDDSKTKPDTEQKEDNAEHVPAGVEAVDLGLPSGTKWANMNVGATTLEDYGNSFAWGETEPITIRCLVFNS